MSSETELNAQITYLKKQLREIRRMNKKKIKTRYCQYCGYILYKKTQNGYGDDRRVHKKCARQGYNRSIKFDYMTGDLINPDELKQYSDISLWFLSASGALLNFCFHFEAKNLTNPLSNG